MKAAGYACDVCNTFQTAAANDRVPVGWMTLIVEVPEKSSRDAFDICSNRCLRDLGRERWRADVRDDYEPSIGKPRKSNGQQSTGKNVSEEGREKLRQSGLRLQHNKGNHENNPNVDCELCLEEYTSAK